MLHYSIVFKDVQIKDKNEIGITIKFQPGNWKKKSIQFIKTGVWDVNWGSSENFVG